MASTDSKPGLKTPPVIPPIPFDREEDEAYAKGRFVVMRLRANPQDDKSPTHDVQVPYFYDGTCEQLLEFIEKVRAVCVGQALVTGPQKFSFMRQVLKGGPLAQWNYVASTQPGMTESDAEFEICLRSLVSYVFPRQALELQTRYMRHHMRKPYTMKVKHFKNRVLNMNNMLQKFPPDFLEAQKLSDSELKEIIQYAMPVKWNNEMIRQNFDPTKSTLHELIEFYERQECVESMNPQRVNESDTKQAGKGPSGKTGPSGGHVGYDFQTRPFRGRSAHEKRTSNKTSTGKPSYKSGYDADKWCELHQVHGHDLSTCHLMVDQAKKMRAAWESSKAGETSGDRARKKQREEKALQAYVHDMVASELKKRKSPPSHKQVHFAEDEYRDRKSYESSDDEILYGEQDFKGLSLGEQVENETTDEEGEDEKKPRHEVL